MIPLVILGLYQIGKLKQYKKQEQRQSLEIKSLEEKLVKLESKVFDMNYNRQLEIVKLERLIVCTGMNACIEKLNQQEDEEIFKIIQDRTKS